MARRAAPVDHCLSLCCLMLNIDENFFSCIAFGVFHCFSWVPPPDTCLSMGRTRARVESAVRALTHTVTNRHTHRRRSICGPFRHGDLELDSIYRASPVRKARTRLGNVSGVSYRRGGSLTARHHWPPGANRPHGGTAAAVTSMWARGSVAVHTVTSSNTKRQ